jgi:hypothetical protein
MSDLLVTTNTNYIMIQIIDSITRFKNTLAIFRLAKYSYSYYKLLSIGKYEPLIYYYTSLQHIHLFAENTLILQLSILLTESEKFSLSKVLNNLFAEKRINKLQFSEFKTGLNFDSKLIGKIKDFRNKYVSHIDFKAAAQHPDFISYDEYEILLSEIEALLSKLMRSLEIDESLNIISPISMETTLDNLAEFYNIKFKKHLI